MEDETEYEAADWWKIEHVEIVWNATKTIAPESVEYLLKIAKERYPKPCDHDYSYAVYPAGKCKKCGACD